VTGRSEVRRLQKRLDAIFQRARETKDDEIRSDLARFLCILVSGWFEKSLVELLLQFSRSSRAPVVSYIQNSLGRLTNVRSDRLFDVLGSFDAKWREEFEKIVVDEHEAALNSVIALRNDISHGGSATVSFATISAYYARIDEIVTSLADRLDPPPQP
jgi:RiboL-PSP-HEPN